MALQVSINISQSVDAKTLTITDNSNYGSQGINVNDVDRAIPVYDSNNTLVNTILFPTTGALTTEYLLTKDQYLSFRPVFTYLGQPYTETVNYLATQFYQVAQVQAALLINCSCKGTSALCTNLTKSREYYNAAVTSFAAGLGAEAQSLIDAANVYIDQSVY